MEGSGKREAPHGRSQHSDVTLVVAEEVVMVVMVVMVVLTRGLESASCRRDLVTSASSAGSKEARPGQTRAKTREVEGTRHVCFIYISR